MANTVVRFDAGTNGVLSELTSGKIYDGRKNDWLRKDHRRIPRYAISHFSDAERSGAVRGHSGGNNNQRLRRFSPRRIFSRLPERNSRSIPRTIGAVFAANTQKVGWFDMRQNSGVTMSTAPRGTVITGNLTVSPSTAAWARSLGKDDAHFIHACLLRSSLRTIATTTVSLGSPVKGLSWVTGNLLGILSQNGSFFLYDTNQQTLQKIADDVRSVSVTQDGSRIATLESHSLEIFTLNDPLGYYRFNLPDIADARRRSVVSRQRSSFYFLSRPRRVPRP